MLWLRILKAKYFPDGSPLNSTRSAGSQFWRQLLAVKDDCRSLVTFSVGDGRSVHFWLDWWTREDPPSSAFPTLFSYCALPSISVAELAASEWNFGFSRMLSPEELEEWHCLVALLPVLSGTTDSVSWPWSASDRFSVKSAYAKLSSGPVASHFCGIRRARIPLKIKIFMWQAMRGRLPVADQIKKRNGPGSEFCALYGAVENMNHILFTCPLARLFWSCLRDWLQVMWAPNSFGELLPLVNGLGG